MGNDNKTNLWDETVEDLKSHGKTFDDVRFVTCRPDAYGDKEFEILKENFELVARNYDYDGGYGGVEVSPYLKIVGDDWWMERHEYDGSEWWEFKTLPKRPDKVKVVTRFMNDYPNYMEVKED